MKAMVLERTGPIESSPLRLLNIPEPIPGPGQVRIKIRCCAACRTDLHVIEGELPSRKLPLVPGHQIVGVVDRLGQGSGRFGIGRRIGVAWLRHTDGTCRFCQAGMENLCENQQFTGYHADGGYARYTVINEDFAYEIPLGFDDVRAAPLLCAGIVGYRAFKRANVSHGGKLAIYGFGSIAHVIMQIARYMQCDVYVVSRDSAHLELARKMGACWVGTQADQIPSKVQSAIIFAPVGHLVPAALEKLDKGGTLSLAGIYMTQIPPLDYQKHLFYERQIRSVTANTRQDGRELLELAEKIPIRPVTSAYPFERTNQALIDLKADRVTGSAVVVMED